ncbi:MAG TPA: TetR/AcrR family transcriptional regulator [Gemmatimonadales bacterium]|nr:TetR/AcrR family transcriptional regulator [Gemmatimonadales bacterium]
MGSDCAGRPPKWQRRPEARPAEIVEAAIEAFGQLGYERATLADVARRAGVCSGTVAHYFGSKGGLFEAAITERFGRFVAEEELALGTKAGPAWPRLERLLRGLWDHLWAPGTLELIRVVRVCAAEFPEASHIIRREMSERWRRLVVAVLEDGIRAGEFRRELDPQLMSRIIGYALVGVADSVAAFAPHDEKMPSPETVWEFINDMVKRLLQEVEPAKTPGRKSRRAQSKSGPRAGEAV